MKGISSISSSTAQIHRPARPGAPRSAWTLACTWVFTLALCLTLSACGFRVKGTAPLPFQTLYTNISPDSEFGAGLRRAILAASPGLRIVDRPQDADARLVQLSMNQSLRDISIDARGRVEEYELNLEFRFQLTDARDRFLLEPITLRALRELPYDPDAVQARQGEITTVFRNMQRSMIDRILRRLTAPEVTQAWHNASNQPRDTQNTDLTPLPANAAQAREPVL